MTTNRDVLNEIITRAEAHELSCQCELHKAGARLTMDEMEQLRALLTRSEGLSFLLVVLAEFFAHEQMMYLVFRGEVLRNVIDGPDF